MTDSTQNWLFTHPIGKKMCSTVFDLCLTLTCFVLTESTQNWLFHPLDREKNVFDCLRPVFDSNMLCFDRLEPKLAFHPLDREKMCSTVFDLCLALTCFVLTDSTQFCYVFINLTMFSTIFDPSLICFDRLNSNWLCFEQLFFPHFVSFIVRLKN